MPASEAVRLRSARAKDRFSDPIGPVPEWRNVTAKAVVPRSSDDYEQRGQIIISGFMVALPPNTEIQDTDEVEVRGEVHQIDGVVADFRKKGKIFYTKRVN